MDLVRRARRHLGAALLTSLVATIASVAPAAAVNPDNLTVTGGSASTLTLILGDTSASFGTNLTPTGVASNGEAAVVATVAVGSCYDYTSIIAVSSNVVSKSPVVRLAQRAGMISLGVRLRTSSML